MSEPIVAKVVKVERPKRPEMWGIIHRTRDNEYFTSAALFMSRISAEDKVAEISKGSCVTMIGLFVIPAEEINTHKEIVARDAEISRLQKGRDLSTATDGKLEAMKRHVDFICGRLREKDAECDLLAKSVTSLAEQLDSAKRERGEAKKSIDTLRLQRETHDYVWRVLLNGVKGEKPIAKEWAVKRAWKNNSSSAALVGERIFTNLSSPLNPNWSSYPESEGVFEGHMPSYWTELFGHKLLEVQQSYAKWAERNEATTPIA